MLSGIHSSLVHMEVYDYEAYARHEMLDNLELRIEMCYLIGEPIKKFGQLFNNPFENKVYVLRRAFSKRGSCYPKGLMGAMLIVIRFTSQPTKNLKLNLTLNSRLKELLRKLTYFHLFLIDLIEEIIH